MMGRTLSGWAFVAGILCAAPSWGVTTFDTSVTPAKSNSDFIAGAGIPSNRFAVDLAGTGETVALKARGRDTGQPMSLLTDTYFVQAGLAADNVNPWWNFDFQFSPGTTGLAATDYVFTLLVDFDPAVGDANFAILSFHVGDNDNNVATAAWDETTAFAVNPGPGAWSNDNVPYVVSDSYNLGFALWTQPPFGRSFNPNIAGEYEISAHVARESDVNNPVAKTTIYVVVPEPGATLAWGLILFGVGVMQCRARRR